MGMGRDIGRGDDIEIVLVLLPFPDVVSRLEVEMGTEVQEIGISRHGGFLLLSVPDPIPSPMLRPITLLLKWWVL